MNKNGTENGTDTSENNYNIVDGGFKVSGFGVRHQQCFIMFVCLATAYSMRACIGVALVGMIGDHIVISVNLTEVSLNTTDAYIRLGETVNASQFSAVNTTEVKETDSDELESGFLHALLLMPNYPKFHWTKQVQDIVISSFFWGYMILQIPAGQLVHKVGPRRLIVGAMTINCVVSFCFPWAAYYGGWIFAVICRLMQGLSQACIIPGLYGFFGQWAPLSERSRLVGFAQGGQAIGTVLGLPTTGFIAASPLGWPGIFRFYGILSGLVALLVFFLISDTPAQHPKISAEERRYIEEGIGIKYGEKQVLLSSFTLGLMLNSGLIAVKYTYQTSTLPLKKLPVPWRDILRCKALYGILISHISQTWGQLTLFAEIPSFMDKVMGVSIKSNGMLTALPFLVMWIANFFWNWITDWIIIKKYMSITNARKLANTFGSVPPAIGLVILAFAPKTVASVEGILIFICVFKIATHVGSMVTHIDITPNFASTTMSISNFMSNLVGSQAPLVAGFLLTDVTSEKQWRNVFFVSAGLYFFTNIVYVVLGTAEKAPWNDPPREKNDAESPETELMIKDLKIKE